MFSAWMMLLRCFPEITPDIVRESFLSTVISSPWHIEHALHTLGFTVAEIREHCHWFDNSGSFHPGPDTMLWAKLHY
ncbi:hypothetical protein Pelo_16785 [Pelomyxa schiedti]|nr:hypothetical protein Pelo_16785 [Pelomyxa schiedti]